MPLDALIRYIFADIFRRYAIFCRCLCPPQPPRHRLRLPRPMLSIARLSPSYILASALRFFISLRHARDDDAQQAIIDAMLHIDVTRC